MPLALAQLQSNGTQSIAPHPPDMPANDQYSTRLVTTGAGKFFGFMPVGLADIGIDRQGELEEQSGRGDGPGGGGCALGVTDWILQRIRALTKNPAR